MAEGVGCAEWNVRALEAITTAASGISSHLKHSLPQEKDGNAASAEMLSNLAKSTLVFQGKKTGGGFWPELAWIATASPSTFSVGGFMGRFGHNLPITCTTQAEKYRF